MLKYLFNTFRALLTWQRMAVIYDQFRLPSRPSDEDLRFYKGALADHARGKVLILGVTPQLRQLASQMFKDIFVVDFSRAMYESSNAMVDESIRRHENFLWLNWLDLGKIFPGGYFDAIVGDLVFIQIHPEKREYFISLLCSFLRPGGSLITRVKLHNPLWKGMNALEIIRRNIVENSGVWKVSPYIMYRLGDHFLDKDYSFRSKDFAPYFQQVIQEGVDLDSMDALKYAVHFFNKIDMVRSYPTKETFEGVARKFFASSDVGFSGDYEESAYFPIYIFKK